MKIGYSFWGFLGDHKEDDKGNPLSTPDGNAAYGLYLIDALQKAGHEVVFLQQDRDWTVFQRRGKYDFSSFSEQRRFGAYLKAGRNLGFPDIDVLFLEWRFPIPGRNTPDMIDSPNYQPCLQRQNELINHYRAKGTKIIIWDLDHKLTIEEERDVNPLVVLETSASPRKLAAPRMRVEPPVAITDLMQHKPLTLDKNRKLVYIGSRYERDDVIEEWIRPVSDRFPGQVEFWGNWTADYNFAEVKAKWPNVKYCDRIAMKDFSKAYGSAVAVPLLAKKSYLETGFITPRIWEALIFGSLPVGLSHHRDIHVYLPSDLIARDAQDLGDIVQRLSVTTAEEREQLRHAVAARIEFMDASNFVKVIESVIN